MPHHLKIEGARRPDFSDAVILLETESESISDTGPIMMWNIPEKTCRYIRLAEVNPADSFRIGFAEIELFSNYENIALGKQVSSSESGHVNRNLGALTDGLNLYGEILPIRDWLNQLARRQDLEAQRPQLAKELAQRYASQKNSLRLISWLAALLLLVAIVLIWFQHIARQRAISRTRERIAANLHDELGANLHAIGLLGDFAKKIVARKNATDEWAELSEVVDEVRSLTEETGETARYCTNMLETKGVHANLVEEMKRTSNRMLADLEHETNFPDEESLHQLKPRRRIDLYLFYKECLTNIIRHSGATRVSAELSVSDQDIRLIVSDNGHGLMGAQEPESLRRRAKMLGGSVNVDSLDSGGTQITLQLSLRRRLPFLPFKLKS
jgi:signal transduction histidine kinase